MKVSIFKTCSQSFNTFFSPWNLIIERSKGHPYQCPSSMQLDTDYQVLVAVINKIVVEFHFTIGFLCDHSQKLMAGDKMDYRWPIRQDLDFHQSLAIINVVPWQVLLKIEMVDSFNKFIKNITFNRLLFVGEFLKMAANLYPYLSMSFVMWHCSSSHCGVKFISPPLNQDFLIQ